METNMTVEEELIWLRVLVQMVRENVIVTCATQKADQD
jgi:hypothetical protein